MTSRIGDLQRCFSKYAEFKAKIRNVMVNGKICNVTFTEYKAPENDVEEWRKYNGSDGHFYYIIISTKIYEPYYGREMTRSTVYLTNREEGNEIYKQIKATNTLIIND